VWITIAFGRIPPRGAPSRPRMRLSRSDLGSNVYSSSRKSYLGGSSSRAGWEGGGGGGGGVGGGFV
jgi:hypothetical protein